MIAETQTFAHFTAEHYAHLASLVLYSVVFVFAADTLRDAPNGASKTLRSIIRSFLVLVMSLAFVFGSIQVWWVVSNGPEATPDPTAAAWLIFDWANGLAYFAFVSAVRVYLRWTPVHRPCVDAPEGCPRLKEFRERRDASVQPKHSQLLLDMMGDIEKANSLTNGGYYD